MYDLWKKANDMFNSSCLLEVLKESMKTNHVEYRLGKVKNTEKMNGFIIIVKRIV